MTQAVGRFELRSGSGDATTDGVPFYIGATTSPGTLLHTATAGRTHWDIVTIELVNLATVQRNVIVQWGGTDPECAVPYVLPPGIGVVVTIDRRRIRNGLEIRAYCLEAANEVTAYVEVDTYRAAA